MLKKKKLDTETEAWMPLKIFGRGETNDAPRAGFHQRLPAIILS